MDGADASGDPASGVRGEYTSRTRHGEWDDRPLPRDRPARIGTAVHMRRLRLRRDGYRLAVVLLVWTALSLWLGAGRHARVLVWTDVRGGGEIVVTLDGRRAGRLRDYFARGVPTCDAPRGALLLETRVGTRRIAASDAVGRTWSVDLHLTPGCNRLRLAAVNAPPSPGTTAADSGGAEHPMGAMTSRR